MRIRKLISTFGGAMGVVTPIRFERAIAAGDALPQAYQADEVGNLAYRRGMRNFAPAFAMAAGGARVIAICYHCERNDTSKLIPKLTYPPTALDCVTSVVTDLAWIDIAGDGFPLRELAPGLAVDDVKAATAAPLRVASDGREMTLE